MGRKVPRRRAGTPGYHAGCRGKMMASRGMEAVPTCPVCKQNAAIYLPYACEYGVDSYLRYYRCSFAHVWGVHKDKPGVICHVTPLPERPHVSPVK